MRAVVHGDVKPSNIQIGPDDDVRLLDFGIAKIISSTHNLTHHNLGSPAYCSPERVKSVKVDQHADLWGLGVSLYEMIAGLPPYQAQSTRKLENLIQSRRPPRALPENCPAPLKAVISKALAADLQRRYRSAAEFESDLRLFLQNVPTAAELEPEPAWHANATVEKANETPETRVRDPKVRRLLVEAGQIMWTLLAGFLVGLMFFVPAGYFYRLWLQSAPLRGSREYVHRSVSEIGSDWQLYQWTQQQSRLLGGFSPLASTKRSLYTNFVGTANEIIERFRNSSDPAIENYDWAKAQICLKHALELYPADNESRGKLALCKGYAQLMQNPRSSEVSLLAKTSFEEAASYMPRSPDPHLGLARIHIYGFHNVGRALAEFHEAERVGFRPGPREMEQQADGYLFRAEQELQQSMAAGTPKAKRTHYLLLAQRDLVRARSLYEPISGFSNASQHLEQVYQDETQEEQLRLTALNVKPQIRQKPRQARSPRWR
jgi:hypothetical protein